MKNDMSDKTLDAALDSQIVMPPGDLLKARILAAARNTAQDGVPANDRRRVSWKQISGIAATFIICGVIGWIGFAPNTEAISDTVYLEAALDLGVDDVYRWVEGEPEDGA